MIRKKKGTLKEGTPGLEKGRTAKLESKPMEAAPPDAAVETAPDMSMGEQISNLPTMTAPDTFSHSDEVFPIVGIGASAGGLEALGLFLANVPAGSGMAFVIVQHMDPTRKGMLPELLQRGTSMKVFQVK